MHILAYNLIRTIMTQATAKHEIEPRSISFRGAVQLLEAFQPMISLRAQRDGVFHRHLYRSYWRPSPSIESQIDRTDMNVAAKNAAPNPTSVS